MEGVLEKYVIEVNRTLTFQYMNHEMSYKPEDPFIRTVIIGIRPQSSESDWLAYVECRLWNIASQKETTFWNYAREYEKEQEKKPFNGVCNYIKLKNTSKKPFINSKTMSGWAVYVSELLVYEDMISKYSGMDLKKMESDILDTISAIIQHSFLVKPSYVFISDIERDSETLETLEFKKIGTVNAGKIALHMKTYK